MVFIKVFMTMLFMHWHDGMSASPSSASPGSIPTAEDVAGADLEAMCSRPADIVFLMDTSRSIYPPDFPHELRFVQDMIGQFDVSPSTTRVAVVSFSEGYREEFNLETYETVEDMQKAVAKIHFTAGFTTDTADAIQYARDVILRHSRPDVTHMIICITDGRSTLPAKTAVESKKTREAGVLLFAVGVGSRVDFEELGHIATRNTSEFVHTAQSFQGLSSIQSLLVYQACQATGVSSSTTTATTTTPTTTTTTPTTTTTTPTTTTTTPTTTTTTPTTTTTTPTTTTTTTTTTTAKPTTTTMTIPTTTTTKATTTSTTPTITTTTTTTPTTTTNPTPSTAKPSAATISSTSAPTPSSTSSATTTISEYPQNDATYATEVCGGKPADMVFVLDRSSSVYVMDFLALLDTVQEIVKVMDIAPDKTQIAAVSFSTNATVEFYLDDFQTQGNVLARIGKIQYTGGVTETGLALSLVRDAVLSPERGARGSAVARVVIVITDGLSQNMLFTKKEAEALKKDGVHVFAVGVGPDADKNELENIASRPLKHYVFQVNSYGALESIEYLLATKACHSSI